MQRSRSSNARYTTFFFSSTLLPLCFFFPFEFWDGNEEEMGSGVGVEIGTGSGGDGVLVPVGWFGVVEKGVV